MTGPAEDPSFLSLLTGCLATPISENPTVVMVEAAYRHHGIDARYINCDVRPADLGAAVRGAWAMGWLGFNCSLPHKVAVIEHLSALGESARVIGAVNTVVRGDDGWVGENTDGRGFVEALREKGILLDGQRIALLGAGGAARAIAVESALAGAASIEVVNRDRGRGEALAALVNEQTPADAAYRPWDEPYPVPTDVDLLVNATSVGLHPDPNSPAVEAGTLREGMVVADVIPNPPRTAFLRQAEEAGCVTIDGLGMLVGQGVLAVGLWTGIRPDPAVMRRALANVFGG